MRKFFESLKLDNQLTEKLIQHLEEGDLNYSSYIPQNIMESLTRSIHTTLNKQQDVICHFEKGTRAPLARAVAQDVALVVQFWIDCAAQSTMEFMDERFPNESIPAGK